MSPSFFCTVAVATFRLLSRDAERLFKVAWLLHNCLLSWSDICMVLFCQFFQREVKRIEKATCGLLKTRTTTIYLERTCTIPHVHRCSEVYTDAVYVKMVHSGRADVHSHSSCLSLSGDARRGRFMRPPEFQVVLQMFKIQLCQPAHGILNEPWIRCLINELATTRYHEC